MSSIQQQNFEKHLNNFIVQVIDNLPAISYTHEQLQQLQQLLQKMQTSININQEELPEFSQQDKTPLYTIINYLSQLLPTENQINTLLNNSAEDAEFYHSIKQLYKNLNYSQQVNQQEIFEVLIVVYNYAVNKLINHFKQLIFDLYMCSGISNVTFSQLQLNNPQLFKQNKLMEIISIKQFQLIKLLNPVILQNISHVRENRYQLFNSSFQQPYILIIQQFYLQNYKQFFQQLKKQQQQLLNQSVSLISSQNNGAQNDQSSIVKFQQLITQLNNNILNENNYFYIKVNTPSILKTKQVQIFTKQYINTIDVQNIYDYIKLFNFEFLEEINYKFSMLQIAPFQIQVISQHISQNQLLLLQQLKIKGFKYVFQQQYQLNNQDQLLNNDASNSNLFINKVLLQLLYLVINYQFESGIQQKLFQSVSNQQQIFEPLFAQYNEDFKIFIDKQYKFKNCQQLIFCYIIIQAIQKQINANTSIQSEDQGYISNNQLYSNGQYFNIINQQLCNLLSQLMNKIQIFIQQQLSLLSNVQTDYIYKNYVNQMLQNKLYHFLTLPPFYVLNNLYVLVNLFQIDQIIGIQLFRTLECVIEEEIVIQGEQQDEEQLIILIRIFNSYYVMHEVFVFENVEFLINKTNKKYKIFLNKIINYFVQKYQNIEDQQLLHKVINNILNIEPYVLLGLTNRRVICEKIETSICIQKQ